MKNLYSIVLFIACLATVASEATTVVGGVAGTLTVKNSIIYNDTTYSQVASSATITNSAVRGNSVPVGTGNFSLSSSAYSALTDAAAVASVNAFSYYLSPTSTSRNAGTNSVTVPSTDINGNDRIYDLTIDVGAVEYSEIYKGGSATWETASDWNTGRIPQNVDIVTTRSACHVTSTSTTAVCKKLIIESSGTLTINPNTQLIVSDSIRNKDVTKLIVKAGTDSITPNGTLIFYKVGNPVYGTVEMYSRASWDLNASTNSKYRWQYFGLPVKSIAASPTFDGAYVRSWNEAENDQTKHWVQLSNTSTLNSFMGYEICQSGATTYSVQGQLINRDTTMTLSYHSNGAYPGQNIYANPYTAAIKISKLNFDSNTERSVYLYSTGTYQQWSTKGGSSNLADSPGQYIAVPTALATQLGYDSIPSMQGFLVKTLNATTTTFGITYNSLSVTKNTRSLRAPAATKTVSTDYEYTRIDVTGAQFSDRMWIFTIPGCTRSFNNGWDGHKLMGSTLTPQLYVLEGDGDYQVKSVGNMNNTFLGFQPGEDSNYTLTFKHENLDKYYSSVYLLDLAENKTVDMTADSSQYSFTAEASGKQSKRFKIVTIPIESDTLSVARNIKIFSSERTIFVNNLSNLNGTLALYDISGRLVKLVPFGANGITPIQTSFPSGVYIVKATTRTLGRTERIMLQ